jgi:hypothetical protein
MPPRPALEGTGGSYGAFPLGRTLELRRSRHGFPLRDRLRADSWASQFDLRIEVVVGEQIGAPGPAGLGNARIDVVLRLGGGGSGGRGS